MRLFDEQYVVMDGKAVLRDKKEVKADSLQNPNDPDATYRAKNDQKVQGYVTNITETVEEGKPNIITSVQVDKVPTIESLRRRYFLIHLIRTHHLVLHLFSYSSFQPIPRT